MRLEESSNYLTDHQDIRRFSPIFQSN